MKDWIIICGQPIDTVRGGGYEFYGPFTDTEAHEIRQKIVERYQKAGRDPHGEIVMAVQLLHSWSN